MLEKRKRYVKFIILTILCIVLAGVSVLEGILYLQTKKEYRNLQAQNNKLEQTCQEKDTQLIKTQQEVEELKQQIQTLQTQNVKEEGSSSSDTGLKPGDIISKEEVNDNNIDQYFTASSIPRNGEIFNRINGKSYRDNSDITLGNLRYLTMLHYNFDHQIQVGEMIVNVAIQDDVLKIFKELFENEYEIQSMYLIDNYWQDGYDGNKADSNSIENNNTSCFCYRPVTGGENVSNHGYGRAIDINPQQNPYVFDGQHTHSNADPYVTDRNSGEPHVIVASESDICYSTFMKYGFSWGGDWENPIDYQHFEKPAV